MSRPISVLFIGRLAVKRSSKKVSYDVVQLQYVSSQLTVDLRDPKQREEFMVALLEQSNQCMMEGE